MTFIILIAFWFIILLFHLFCMHRKPLTYEFYYFNIKGHNFGLWRLIIGIIYLKCMIMMYFILFYLNLWLKYLFLQIFR